MAFKYFIEQNQADSHQGDYHWFAVIVRFETMKTFSRDKIIATYGGRGLDISKSDIDPVQELSPLILSSRIQSFVINSSKSSHVSTAAFSVAPGTQLDRLVHAGDWILFWVHDNKKDNDETLLKVKASIASPIGLGANSFHSGLKFVGRVNAPKQSFRVDPDSGRLSSSYELTAVGFQEFDQSIYYTPMHQSQGQIPASNVLEAGAKLQANLESVLQETIPTGVETKLLQWLNIFLGVGPGDASKGYANVPPEIGETERQIQKALQQSPNDSYLVPRTVALLLGVPGSFSDANKYVDLLSIFIGVQRAKSVSSALETRRSSPFSGEAAAQGFAFDSVAKPSGSFLAQITDLNDTSVWSLLQRFSNGPINEMYTCLRANSEGKITPTFVCRQTPYSSRRLAERSYIDGGRPVEAFVNLPRWVIGDSMVQGGKVGASDSLRINYSWITGTNQQQLLAQNQDVVSAVSAPGMADIADVKRNGLRTFIRSVNSNVDADFARDGWFANVLIGDCTLDQHLKWSGNLELRGIQEPICVGDNLEFRDVIYHIESVVHSGHIDGNNGKKTFTTSVSLSNGVSTLSESGGLFDSPDTVYPHEVSALDHQHELPVDVERDLSEFEGLVDFSSDRELQNSDQATAGDVVSVLNPLLSKINGIA